MADGRREKAKGKGGKRQNGEGSTVKREVYAARPLLPCGFCLAAFGLRLLPSAFYL
jgi:hypothetical protein